MGSFRHYFILLTPEVLDSMLKLPEQTIEWKDHTFNLMMLQLASAARSFEIVKNNPGELAFRENPNSDPIFAFSNVSIDETRSCHQKTLDKLVKNKIYKRFMAHSSYISS